MRIHHAPPHDPASITHTAVRSTPTSSPASIAIAALLPSHWNHQREGLSSRRRSAISCMGWPRSPFVIGYALPLSERTEPWRMCRQNAVQAVTARPRVTMYNAKSYSASVGGAADPSPRHDAHGQLKYGEVVEVCVKPRLDSLGLSATAPFIAPPSRLFRMGRSLLQTRLILK